MGFLIELGLRWGLSRGRAKILAWAIVVVAIAAIAGGAIALVYHRGETAGGAETTIKVERQHAKTVGEARADERTAQTVGDQVAAATTARTVGSAANERTTIQEIHDALDATPPAVAGAAPPVFDARGVSASLNRVVDRANGAAAAAEPRP